MEMITLQNKNIPEPAIYRLCKIYSLLEGDKTIGSISSKEIGDNIGAGSHNIRKDLAYIEGAGITGSGYDAENLKENLKKFLGLNIVRKASLIGLDLYGTGILEQHSQFVNSVKIVAGFDSNINRVDTIKTDINVYPIYQLEEIIETEKIEILIVTSLGARINENIEKYIKAGIKGVINLSNSIIKAHENIIVRNINFPDEIRYLSALMEQNNK
jgi:redox-sensing transcriptional repressor